MEATSLTLHIIAGTIALATTFIAVPFKKGTTLHNASGKIYFYAMTVVFLTALHLSLTDDPINWFLFSVGIFSYYLAFAGWRAATERKNLPTRIDWFAAWLMLACTLFMYYVGYTFISGQRPIGWVLIVFGTIGGLSATEDLLRFRKGPIRGKERIVRHLSRMLPSLIAVFTAVLVVNGDKLGLPPLVAWLGPTVVLAPVITIWNIWFRMPPQKRKGWGKRLVSQALRQANITDT